MTNKVCIPIDIFRNSKLSPRARLIWGELSLLPRGVNGEFVIHQKELSLQLGICVSTLRRAIKSLEENQLIQFVGLSDQYFKKFIFKSDGVDEKIPLPPFSKGELEPKPVEKIPLPSFSKVELEPKPVEKNPLPPFSKGELEPKPVEKNPPTPFFQGGLNPKIIEGELLKSPFFQVGISPELNPGSIDDAALKSPLEKGGRGILATSSASPSPASAGEKLAPKETEQVLLRLKYKFPGGAPKPSDAENLAFTSAFYQIFHSRWLEEFPLLNGKDNRPLLDYDLIEMIVFSYPINLTGRQLNTAIKDELQHFSEVPFADAQNPAWKPGLRRNAPKFCTLGLDTAASKKIPLVS